MGRPRGIEPVLSQRPSRLEPRAVLGVDVPHWTVTYCVDYSTGRMLTRSFVPADPAPLPWWLLWRALLFDGRVRDGDDCWTSTLPPVM